MSEQTFFTLSQVKLHAAVAGPAEGPLVILLHGFPEHWYSWRHQIPALAAAGFRVIAPDQRGYNLSEKPSHIKDYAVDTLTQDIVDLIEQVGRKKAIIVGHDWGGVVAYRLAMDYPDQVKKLVILNSPHPRAFAREAKKFRQLRRSWYMFYFRLPWLPESLFNFTPKLWAKKMFQGTAINKAAFSDKEVEVMAKAMAQPGAMRSMLHWYRAAFRFKPKNRTQQIQMPTLIIWGEEDVALNIHLLDGMEPWFEGPLHIERIPDRGHWIQNEAPKKVNQLLLDFL